MCEIRSNIQKIKDTNNNRKILIKGHQGVINDKHYNWLKSKISYVLFKDVGYFFTMPKQNRVVANPNGGYDFHLNLFFKAFRGVRDPFKDYTYIKNHQSRVVEIF